MIGDKIYKDNFNQEKYTKLAIWCNENNARIEDKGEYYEAVENEAITPTLEEQLIELEAKYNMPRVLREGILANPTAYSEFNVNRAKELEAIAEEIRRQNTHA